VENARSMNFSRFVDLYVVGDAPDESDPIFHFYHRASHNFTLEQIQACLNDYLILLDGWSTRINQNGKHLTDRFRAIYRLGAVTEIVETYLVRFPKDQTFEMLLFVKSSMATTRIKDFLLKLDPHKEYERRDHIAMVWGIIRLLNSYEQAE
jgi:hypothetical protein